MLTKETFERRLAEEFAKFRVEMAQGFGSLRGEIAQTRADLIKWSFLFWIGQVVAIASILGFMLRLIGAAK
jgi:hypothetical protein